MRLVKPFLVTALLLVYLNGCSPVKSSIDNQYQLDSFSDKSLSKATSTTTILVSAPEAVSGYQTDQMMYVNKKFELASFAHSAWISPPADMLYPLIVQSLQRSGYFHAVASGGSSELTDYRIDTQLIELKQSFLQKPSKIELTVKYVLSAIANNKVLASRIVRLQIPCTSDTPYGGVIAANKAVQQFTADLTQFVLVTLAHNKKKTV